jgi:N-acetylglucosamine kinase-like BadF-type ATPase
LRCVLGIDAGGTKTVGLLADEQGRVVAETRAGGANLQTHGELEVEKVLHGIIETLADSHEIAAICLGIAGVDRPQDEAVIQGIFRRLGRAKTARVVNDAVIALVAGSPERTGIVVLAGTGSIVYGVAAGKAARAGGYGYLLADEGSGYWLGHQALRAVVRCADGRGPETRLSELVFGALRIRSVPELVPLVYEKGLERYRIAALAPLVQQAADAGDDVARRLLELAAEELGLATRAVAARLPFGDARFRVVLAGGVFRACPSLVSLLGARLGLAAASPELLDGEPARGAVTLALDLIHERR